MSKSKLGALWREGKTAWGTWLMLSDPVAAEAVAHAGYDYICIDVQHGLIDYSHALSMLQAVNLANIVPMVRTASNSADEIGRYLDAGAMGVIVPQVNTVEQAERAVEAAFYPPRGQRSWGPMRPLIRQGMSYYQNVNNEVMVVPQIETAEALENIELILAVSGIDMVLVGPVDLRISMGLSPQQDGDEPEFVAALETIVAACNEADVIPAVHATASVALAKKREEQGFRMITAAADIAVLQNGMGQILQGIRS